MINSLYSFVYAVICIIWAIIIIFVAAGSTEAIEKARQDKNAYRRWGTYIAVALMLAGALSISYLLVQLPKF